MPLSCVSPPSSSTIWGSSTPPLLPLQLLHPSRHGTGYNVASMLSNIGVDTVKVDMFNPLFDDVRCSLRPFSLLLFQFFGNGQPWPRPSLSSAASSFSVSCHSSVSQLGWHNFEQLPAGQRQPICPTSHKCRTFLEVLVRRWSSNLNIWTIHNLADACPWQVCFAVLQVPWGHRAQKNVTPRTGAI